MNQTVKRFKKSLYVGCQPVKLWKPSFLPGQALLLPFHEMDQQQTTVKVQPKQGGGQKNKIICFIVSTCFLLDVLLLITKYRKVFQKHVLDIDKMQTMLAAVAAIKDMKKNPGGYLETDCEKRGTRECRHRKIVSLESWIK